LKAIVVSAFGGPEQLRLTEAAEPVAGAGQVRIAVHACGVNPVDAGNRADGTWAGLRAPCILGYDVAGVVDQVGDDVSALAVGDRVMAMTRFPDGAGGYAELVVVDADQVARVDTTVSFIAAAATPLAAGTGSDVLARLNLQPGARILVLGASGGVGMFFLQLASRYGLDPVAVGRPEMHETMRALGAAHCVDYTREDVAYRTKQLAGGPVDAIADFVGGALLTSAVSAVKAGGALATIASPALPIDPIVDHNLTLHGVLINNDGDRTRRLAALLASGALRPTVSHVLPLAEAARAHEIVECKHSGGKIVLTVRD
jgi:NADPH2:quinone reductase